MENSWQHVVASGPSVMATKSLEPMKRPSTGTLGVTKQVTTNFFKMQITDPSLKISQYSIQISEKLRNGEWGGDKASITPISFNRSLLATLFDQNASDFQNLKLAYDGRSNAYSIYNGAHTLNGAVYTFLVTREGGTPLNTTNERTKKMKVTFAHAKDLLFQPAASWEPSTEHLSALNAVLASDSSDNYIKVGRSFYDRGRAVSLGDQSWAEVWPGFCQSVRHCEKGLVVNLDESHKAFWKNGDNLLVDLVGRRKWNRLDRMGSAKLNGLKVRATHTGNIYTVHLIHARNAKGFSFEHDGHTMTVEQYFLKQYNITLRRSDLRLVQVNRDREIVMPEEVLEVIGNQRYFGELDSRETQTMVRKATSFPTQRIETAKGTIEKLYFQKNGAPNAFFSQWKLSVSRDPIVVNARVLPGLRSPGKKLFKAKTLKDWAILNICDRAARDPRNPNPINLLVHAARSMGMTITDKPLVVGCAKGEIGSSLTELVRKYRRRPGNVLPQLIVVVTDDQDARYYNAVKFEGDAKLGIVTQVTVASNWQKRRYWDNVVLKINAKLGGLNSMPLTNRGEPSCTHIVLGADVTHPKPGSASSSIAALVGSIDKDRFQFSSTSRTLGKGEEIIAPVGDMFKELYQRFTWNNQRGGSKRIIMFRDGVSDGQYQDVLDTEVAALRDTCRREMHYNPVITYIIVTKRHHAKFLASSNEDQNKNIGPGTIIDTGIVSKKYYEFYLNSHTGRLGTNKPSKYTVLIDENHLSVNVLQGYVYALAHGFARCSTPVSMVKSAYYAHLRAFRARSHLGQMESGEVMETQKRDPVDNDLNRRLYFA